jgi:protein SCO1/2
MITNLLRIPHGVSAFLLVLNLLIVIITGCASSRQTQESDKSMNEIVFAEGRGSNPDSAGHISRPDRQSVYLLPNPKQLQDFQLTDDGGRLFNRLRLMNHWTFMYFGYTNCPDVCPMTTSLLNKVYSALSRRPEIQSDTQVVFVSVDPMRDTPQSLRSYINYFNEKFIAVVGPENSLDELTGQMDAKHQLLYSENFITHKKTIRVLHDSSIYLIDPLGRIYAIFTPPFTAEMVKERYLSIREVLFKSN